VLEIEIAQNPTAVHCVSKVVASRGCCACESRNHEQLRRHLADFLAAYNFAKRLKMLRGLTQHEYVCQIWTTEPLRFRINQPTTPRDCILSDNCINKLLASKTWLNTRGC
jgi:hypothetical protein